MEKTLEDMTDWERFEARLHRKGQALGPVTVHLETKEPSVWIQIIGFLGDIWLVVFVATRPGIAVPDQYQVSHVARTTIGP